MIKNDKAALGNDLRVNGINREQIKEIKQRWQNPDSLKNYTPIDVKFLTILSLRKDLTLHKFANRRWDCAFQTPLLTEILTEAKSAGDLGCIQVAGLCRPISLGRSMTTWCTPRREVLACM